MTAPFTLQRDAMITRAVSTLAQRSDSSLMLWRTLAIALSKIIGDAGFESLFFRSLYQVEVHHAWMAVGRDAGALSIDHLSTCLATRAPGEAEQVSTALLISFTDTLDLLIGERVTNRILLAAWGTLALNEALEPPQ